MTGHSHHWRGIGLPILAGAIAGELGKRGSTPRQ